MITASRLMVTGMSCIPQGVAFSIKSVIGVMARLNPTLRLRRCRTPMFLLGNFSALLGNNALAKLNPGKKRTNNIPKMDRTIANVDSVSETGRITIIVVKTAMIIVKK